MRQRTPVVARQHLVQRVEEAGDAARVGVEDSGFDHVAHAPILSSQVLELPRSGLEPRHILEHAVEIAASIGLGLDQPDKAVGVVARRESLRGVGDS